jgi:hypothetical protein
MEILTSLEVTIHGTQQQRRRLNFPANSHHTGCGGKRPLLAPVLAVQNSKWRIAEYSARSQMRSHSRARSSGVLRKTLHGLTTEGAMRNDNSNCGTA